MYGGAEYMKRCTPIVGFVLSTACMTHHDEAMVHSLISEVTVVVQFEGTPTLIQTNGDSFMLNEAFGVLYSIRFFECPPAEASLFERPWFTFVQPVYAGHSDILIPTNWNRPSYINLLSPDVITQTIEFQEQSVCDGAVTWARWDGGTFELPTPEPDETFSIHLSGTCTPVNETDEIQFSLQTSVPSEVVRPLNDVVDNDVLDSGQFTALHFQLDIDLTDMLQDVVCSIDLLDNPETNALQVLYNIQQSSSWTSEWL